MWGPVRQNHATRRSVRRARAEGSSVSLPTNRLPCKTEATINPAALHWLAPDRKRSRFLNAGFLNSLSCTITRNRRSPSCSSPNRKRYLPPCIHLITYTGMRRGEALDRESERIDLCNQRLIAHPPVRLTGHPSLFPGKRPAMPHPSQASGILFVQALSGQGAGVATPGRTSPRGPAPGPG